jgi:hypothetical protein
MDEKGIMIPVDPVKEKDLYNRYCSQSYPMSNRYIPSECLYHTIFRALTKNLLLVI